MNSYLLGVIVIGGTTLFSVLGSLLTRKLADVRRFSSHHEVAGYMFSMLGTLYSVVLGFVVVTVSSDMQAARVTLASEANSMLNIQRFADGLPAKNKAEIQAACRCYARSVVEDEWDIMTEGKVSAPTWSCMLALWKAIRNSNPVTQQEQAMYSSILDDYRNMVNGRRIRLTTAHGRVSPVLWTVLIVGAAVTIGFTYFFGVDSLRYQIVMTSLVALVLSLNLYLVMVESHPYEGNFRIPPTPFKIATGVFEMSDVVPQDPDVLLHYVH